MDDLDLDARFVLASARRSLEELRQHPRLLAPADGRGAALASHVVATLNALDAELGGLESEFAAATDEIDRLAVNAKMRLWGNTTGALHRCVPWLESAQLPSVSLGFVYFADEVAKALIQKDADVVTSRDVVYTYSTEAWPFGPQLEDLGQPLGSGPVPIIVSYPLQEDETVFLHPLVAHELAHTAIDEADLLSTILSRYPDAMTLSTDFDVAVRGWTATSGISEPEARVALLRGLRYWLEELVCDSLALAYLGPTYVLSFAAFVLSLSWNEPGEEHPPTTLRIKCLLDQLEDTGWTDVMTSSLPAVGTWLRTVASAAPLPAEAHIDFLRDAMERLAPTVRSVVAEHLSGTQYEAAAYTDSEQEHLQALYQTRILPVENTDREVLDPRAVLLSGWLYALRESGGEPEHLPTALSNLELQQFVAKALEMGTVLRTWRSV